MISKLLLLILALFTSVASVAETSSHRLTQSQSSDDFLFRSISFEFSSLQSDIFWPYPNEPEVASGYAFNIESSQLNSPLYSNKVHSFGVGYKLKKNSQTLWQFELGTNYLDRDTAKKNSWEVSGALNWSKKQNNRLFLSLHLERNLFYQEILVRSLDMKAAKATMLSPNILYLPHNKIRTQLRGNYFWLGDRNTKFNTDLEMLYGVSKYAPWFWLGIGGSFLSHSESKTDYYSPTYFHSYGPRLQFSHSLTQDLSFSIAGSYNWLKEGGGETNKGHYLLTNLLYGKRGKKNFELSFEDIKSRQETSQWSSYGVYLNLNWPF